METDDQHAFYVNGGPVIKRLKSLPAALKKMSKETFQHHVNAEKNDFANWIREVFNKKKLANSIAKIKSKAAMAKKIKDAL